MSVAFPEGTQHGTVVAFLKRAQGGDLPSGWVFRAPEPSERAILLPDDAFEEPEDMEAFAAEAGYPAHGIDTQTMADVAEVLLRLTGAPGDADYLRAYSYYVEFDAFLPALDAPDPPPYDLILLNMDHEFYNQLGPEREGTRCGTVGCCRGAVALSLFCRRHHFEMVQKRPCPFD